MIATDRNTYTLRCSMKTPVGIAEAFRVFQNPHNLAQITPAWLNFRILTPEVRPRGRTPRVPHRLVRHRNDLEGVHRRV